MKKSGKQSLWIGATMIVLFAVWTVLLQFVGVKPAGETGTLVGFASLNCWFHELAGVHMQLYTVTDWLGLVPVAVCFFFGGLGFVQLIQRKSLWKVDGDILLLGLYYGIVILGYLVFEMLPLNYRPVLIEGRMEASYPSSTTLLVLSVMPTLIFQIRCRWRPGIGKKGLSWLTAVFTGFMVIGRLVSGVHWLTDIVGAVFLSGGLFCVYRGTVLLFCKEEIK